MGAVTPNGGLPFSTGYNLELGYVRNLKFGIEVAPNNLTKNDNY